MLMPWSTVRVFVGNTFWRVFLYVFFPGLMIATLLLIPLAGRDWLQVVGVEILLGILMGAILVWKFGADVLSETREEILDDLANEEDPVPGGLPAGEYGSSRDVVEAFERIEDRSLDTPP
jgi:hypothetical protein